MSLHVHGVSRRFGTFLLDRLHLKVGDGEYWVLLGPSGCGKSLLLQTLTGLHEPDEGACASAGDVSFLDLPGPGRAAV